MLVEKLFVTFTNKRIRTMSRIGNNPISIANDITVKVDGKNLEISGKKGSHSL